MKNATIISPDNLTVINHVGLEFKAKTADIAYKNAQIFNEKCLNGFMKAIIVDEIDYQTFWVTLAPNEEMATTKHCEYLVDNGYVMQMVNRQHQKYLEDNGFIVKAE